MVDRVFNTVLEKAIEFKRALGADFEPASPVATGSFGYWTTKLRGLASVGARAIM